MEWVPAPVFTLAAWILTVTFGWAAIAKFVGGPAWPSAVTRFGFRGPAAQIIVFAVPAAEITVVVLFVIGALRPAAALTLALIAAFSAAITRAVVVNGRRVPCGCFGKTTDRDYRLLVLRNGALGVVAALVLAGPPQASLRPPVGADVIPLALALVGAIVVGWAGAQTASALRRR